MKLPAALAKNSTIAKLFGLGADSLVGIDLGASHIRMIEAERQGERSYLIKRSCALPMPRNLVSSSGITDLDKVSKMIATAWEQLDTNNTNVVMAMPTQSVVVKNTLVPSDVDEIELENLIYDRAAGIIPFSIEEVYLDFHLIGPSYESPEEDEVLIVGARRDKVDDRVVAAENAGLQVMAMDVEIYAELNALENVKAQFLGGGRDQIIVLITIGSSETQISFTRNEQQLYFREQSIGGNQLTQEIASRYNMSFEEVEKAKSSGQLPEDYAKKIVKPFIRNIIMATQRVVQDFINSTTYSAIDHVVLAGGGSLLPGIDHELGNVLNCNCIFANPFNKASFSSAVNKPQLMHQAPAFLVASGLAMRK